MAKQRLGKHRYPITHFYEIRDARSQKLSSLIAVCPFDSFYDLDLNRVWRHNLKCCLTPLTYLVGGRFLRTRDSGDCFFTKKAWKGFDAGNVALNRPTMAHYMAPWILTLDFCRFRFSSRLSTSQNLIKGRNAWRPNEHLAAKMHLRSRSDGDKWTRTRKSGNSNKTWFYASYHSLLSHFRVMVSPGIAPWGWLVPESTIVNPIATSKLVAMMSSPRPMIFSIFLKL